MVYIKELNEFSELAINLFASDPFRTKYSLLYRHRESKLIIKVTNDKICLKYKTTQSSDLKEIEKLNDNLFRLMSTETKQIEKHKKDTVMLQESKMGPCAKKRKKMIKKRIEEKK